MKILILAVLGFLLLEGFSLMVSVKPTAANSKKNIQTTGNSQKKISKTLKPPPPPPDRQGPRANGQK
jgi:hypothetical protein